jgi:uncharacterized membrane protein
MNHVIARALCLGNYLALCLLLIYWHAWLTTAPLVSGALLLWVTPLIVLAPGMLFDRLRAYGWGSLVAWLYFTHGVVECVGDTPWLAASEIGLAIGWFIGNVIAIRTHPRRKSALEKHRG